MSVAACRMSSMYSTAVRCTAGDLLESGLSISAVSRALGVSRAAIREWRDLPPTAPTRGECPRCDDAPLDTEAYAALLGYYLGDGCISAAARYWFLRISCDDAYPGIVDDVRQVIEQVRPGHRTFLVAKAGCHDVQSNWVHWPCLFLQHGPGRKHEREIVLEEWQQEIVVRHPGPFLRGLFHSDGCRTINSTTKPIAGAPKTFHYPRWQFTNASEQIRDLCTWALDLVGVAWRRSNPRVISVSRRDAVARMDELIGPKT